MDNLFYEKISVGFNAWFETFLEEKDLPYEQWEIEDQQGNTHIIDNEVVIEAIKSAPAAEQQQIKEKIIMLDFKAGDINDFFKHLAKALVDQRIAGRRTVKANKRKLAMMEDIIPDKIAVTDEFIDRLGSKLEQAGYMITQVTPEVMEFDGPSNSYVIEFSDGEGWRLITLPSGKTLLSGSETNDMVIGSIIDAIKNDISM